MPKKFLIMLLLTGAIFGITTGFTRLRKKMDSTNPMLNIKDLPEQGLRIIAPSDPAFDGLAAPLLQGQPSSVIEALRPYSVLVKNMNHKTVVACLLKWEMMRPNGTVQAETTGFVTLWRLMKQGASGIGEYSIKPNSAWFFSPSSIDINQDTGTAAARTNTPLSPSEERMRDEYLRKVTERLVQYASITVSLDGAFFDDGTFVGPNSTHFFESVEASRNARRDLFREVERDVSRGKQLPEIFKSIEELARKPEVALDSDSTSSDFYNYYQKRVAEEVLQMRQTAGDEKTKEFMMEPLRERWIELKKN
jgi:hypothetical protein